MNPEIKTKWLAALRSGEFKQGKQALATVDAATGETSYCCLGVLCEVLHRDGALTKHAPGIFGKIAYGDASMGASVDWLPLQVMEKIGVTTSAPEVRLDPTHDITHSVAYANDSANKTFLEIADLIEEQL